VPRATEAPEMAPETARDARVVNHRHCARGGLLRIESADGALSGAFADFFRAVEVFLEAGRRPVIVALHPSIGSGQDGDAEGKSRRFITARKTAARGECGAAAAPTGVTAFGIGDAGDGTGRFLGAPRPFDQLFGFGLARIGKLQVGPFARQLPGLDQAAIRVLGNRARHGESAFNERIEGIVSEVSGRDHCLAVAQQDTQAEIAPLRALEILGLAEAIAGAQGYAMHDDGIGVVGAGFFGFFQQCAEQGSGVAIRCHSLGPIIRGEWKIMAKQPTRPAGLLYSAADAPTPALYFGSSKPSSRIQAHRSPYMVFSATGLKPNSRTALEQSIT
jgi:hypothetical protein